MKKQSSSAELKRVSNSSAEKIASEPEHVPGNASISDVIKTTDFASLSPEAIAGIRKLGDDLNQHSQFLLKTSLDTFKHTHDVLSAGTSVYEKLIVLNGGTIALSITLLGSLSSRLTAAHVSAKPHLWMVAVSWSFLLVSTYCCYQVITLRNNGVHGILNRLIAERTRYDYSRIGIFLATISKLLKVEVSTEEGKVQATQIFERIAEATKVEGEEAMLKSTEKTNNMLAGSKGEGVFARVAVWSTMVSVALLCIFTIRSLGLLF